MHGGGWGRRPRTVDVETTGVNEKPADDKPLAVSHVQVPIVEHDNSTILIGYQIGTAHQADGTSIHVIASGGIIEFQIKGPDEDARFASYRVQLGELAGEALAMYQDAGS